LDALIKILTEPKNALIKQYKKLLDMDDVQLEFDEAAIRAIAKKAYDKNTGARGLRAIVEDIMLDIMFEVPSDHFVRKCLVSESVVTENAKPKMIREHRRKDIKPQDEDTLIENNEEYVS